jgi:hypothetical protein
MSEQDKGGSPPPQPAAPAAPPRPDAPPITKVYAGRDLYRDKLPPMPQPPVVPPVIPPPAREQ